MSVPSKYQSEHCSVRLGLVRDYNTRKLTYPEDKLRALQGIAAPWQKMFNCTYVCGMWLESLPLNLLWNMEPHSTSWRIPDSQSTAPSWSWASMQGMLGVPEMCM